MKKDNPKIFILITSIILGMLIVSNIGTSDGSKYMQLSAKEYQDEINERSKLLTDISKLKHSNNDAIDKINEYTYGGKKDERVIEDIKEEIEYNKMVIGTNSVKGNGIQIVLKDGIDNITEDVQDNTLLLVKTLHDNDMIQVINELKLAGAQAISINNQRVLPNSEVMCGWAFLRINGVKTPGPFTVNVIGNPDILISILDRSDSYIRTLKNREISVDIKRKNDMVIAGYTGELNYSNLSGK